MDGCLARESKEVFIATETKKKENIKKSTIKADERKSMNRIEKQEG